MASRIHAGLFLKQRTGVTLRGNLSLTENSANKGPNSLYAAPFIVPQRVNIDRIGYEVTVVGAAGAGCYVGVYADNGNIYPGARIVDGGTMDCSPVGGVGIKLANVDIWLEPGLYWMVFNNNDVTIAFYCEEVQRCFRLTGTGTPHYSVAQAYGALPATYPGGAGPDVGQIPYYRIVTYS